MKVKPNQYIYPPRPAEAIPRDQTTFLGEMGWLAQLKYNDSRALIKYLPDGTIELWNRHGERFRSYHCPDWLESQLRTLRTKLNLAPNNYHLLDGGLLDQKHHSIKNTIVIWDILVRNGTHLLGTTYQERYNSIITTANIPWHYDSYKLGLTWSKQTDHLLIPEIWPSQTWPNLWDMIATINKPYTVGSPGDPDYRISPLIEGLVFKNPLGKLSMGFTEKNNSSWLMRSRVATGRHAF